MSRSDFERARRQLDARVLKRNWTEVVETSGREAAMAPPALRARWEKAHEAAKAVLAALDVAIAAEKAASTAWRAATEASKGRPSPALKLIAGGADEG